MHRRSGGLLAKSSLTLLRAVVSCVAALTLVLGLSAGARAEAFREHAPCPVFTKQVPMTHTWDDSRGQWSCRYILTIIANGLRDAKGHCIIKHIETDRMCVGVQSDGDPSV